VLMFERVEVKRKLIRNVAIKIPGVREYVEVSTAGIGVIERAVEEAHRKSERRIVVQIVIQPRLGRIVKKPVAAPHARLSVSLHVPGKTETRANISQGAFSTRLRNYVTGGQLVARIKKSGRSIHETRRASLCDIHLLDELILAIEQIGHRTKRFPAQPEIQSQARREPECVATIETLVMNPSKFDLAVALPERAHEPKDVVGLVKSAESSIECENARRGIGIVLVIARKHQFAAPGQAMLSLDP